MKNLEAKLAAALRRHHGNVDFARHSPGCRDCQALAEHETGRRTDAAERIELRLIAMGLLPTLSVASDVIRGELERETAAVHVAVRRAVLAWYAAPYYVDTMTAAMFDLRRVSGGGKGG